MERAPLISESAATGTARDPVRISPRIRAPRTDGADFEIARLSPGSQALQSLAAMHGRSAAPVCMRQPRLPRPLQRHFARPQQRLRHPAHAGQRLPRTLTEQLF